MPQAWRIVQKRLCLNAFSGQGARLYGGRWNPPGFSLVYTSSSQALALLEILVHLFQESVLERDYVCIPVDFASDAIEVLPLSALPAQWYTYPAPSNLQQIGSTWIREKRTPVLQVPSAVLPAEVNYLLNPAHPDFLRLSIGQPQAIKIDSRLIGMLESRRQ